MLNSFSIVVVISLIFSNKTYSQNTSEDVVHLSQSTQEIDAPIKIAVDQNGIMYITDAVQDCIIKYDTAGNFVEKIYTEGVPLSMAINNKNELFVGEQDGTILKIDSDGNHTIFYSECGFPSDMDFSPDNILYIVDSKFNQVIVLDILGNLVNIIGEGTFTFPSSIAYDSRKERTLVSEHGGIGSGFSPTCTVWIFDLQGNLTGNFGSNGNDEGEFYRVQGLAIGKCGNIYVSEPFQSRHNLEAIHV